MKDNASTRKYRFSLSLSLSLCIINEPPTYSLISSEIIISLIGDREREGL
jgi:hypothetical protein